MPICPLCRSTGVEEILDRDGVPVLQNVTLRDAVSARRFTQGRIQLLVCTECTFVFNGRFRAALLRYRRGYVNTQGLSPFFRRYQLDIVERLRAVHGLRDSRIVEIGCGNGEMLRMLVGNAARRNTGIGYDPAYQGPRTALHRRVRFERRLFGGSPEAIRADVLFCRQVIEHVPDPVAFLRHLRASLSPKRSTSVFFETSCIEWIFRNHAFHDIYYEHCSLFGPRSFSELFRRAGFRVRRHWHAFRGAYLWIEAEPTDLPPRRVRRPAREVLGLARAFRRAERTTMGRWSRTIEGFDGSTAIWGAGAKGVTIANLLDPDGDKLDCVVDINPAKQGRFLAGTGHPIVSPESLSQRGIDRVLVTNPVYVAEVRRLLSRVSPETRVVPLQS